MVPEIKPQPFAIEQHMHHVTRRWGELDTPVVLELVYLSADDQAVVKHVARYRPDQIAEAAADAAAMNQHGINAYCVVNPVSATNLPKAGKRASREHIVASFFHWADADSAQAANNIKNFVGPKCTMHVLTGTQPSMRPHVYWELEEPTRNLPAWEATQRAIAATLGTDPAVIDAPRIMRLAGTVNWPKPQKQAKGYIAEVTTLRVYDTQERPPVSSDRMARAFVSAAPEAATGLQIDTGSADRKSADHYADILRRTRTDGEKHGGVRDLSAALAGMGVSRVAAEAIIRNACPVWDEGVERLIASAYEYVAKREAAKGGQYATPERIEASSPEAAQAPSGIEWFDDVQAVLTDGYLVKGVLADGAMSVVYGPSNSGKTFFALDLAFHVALGVEWRGLRVRGCAVLYLAAEGGRGLANRIAALREQTGVCNVPFALRRAGLDLLHEQADLQHICNLAAEVKTRAPNAPLLIVVDTLSRVMAGGDENSAADMTALIRNIDGLRAATGAHLMLVHHTGKDTARGARGHSSLRAATDTEIEVQNEDGNRAAVVTKQRDYAGGETFAFTLKSVILGRDQDGDEVTTCLVEAADSGDFKAASNKRGIGGNQKILAETFDQMKAEGLAKPNPGGVGMPDPGQFWTVPMDQFRAACMGKMASSNKRGAFLEAWKGLTENRGLFCAASDLVWRIDRKVNK